MLPSEAAPAFGIYAHVPFCDALCPYCDFAVVVGRSELHERYVDALFADLRAHAPLPPTGSMYVGGGTPTSIAPALLARLIAGIRDVARAPDGIEITVEANPESVSRDVLRAAADAGASRVSLGAQSFAPHVLRALGRTHEPGDIARAVDASRAAGISDVSVDLIFGGPGESVPDWRASLCAAVALDVDHVSAYALTIEERTAFGAAVARGTMRAPDEDELADKYDLACDLLGDAGFEHYEISNWARAQRWSRHNLVYWTQGEYAGVGVGAHSHRGGVRRWNARALAAYMRDPAAREGEERLDAPARAAEWVSLRMRLLEGIDLAEATRRLGRAPDVAWVVEQGLGRVDGGRLLLTRRGMLLENEVTVRLLQEC